MILRSKLFSYNVVRLEFWQVVSPFNCELCQKPVADYRQEQLDKLTQVDRWQNGIPVRTSHVKLNDKR